MENYIKQGGPTLLSEERIELLNTLADASIKRESLPPDIETIWITRFSEIAAAYVAWELEYQSAGELMHSLCETNGQSWIDQKFLLTARADRIDILADGSLTILDYKTGSNPSLKQARNLSPQLALEGYIAAHSGFDGIRSDKIANLAFVRLMQGSRFRVESVGSHKEREDIASIIQNAGDQLAMLVDAYRSPQQGYVSRYAPFMDSEMSGDYDHLARVREWSFGEEKDGNGENA